MSSFDLYKKHRPKNFLEYYHDALEHKEELSIVRPRIHQSRAAGKGEVCSGKSATGPQTFAKLAQVKSEEFE